MRRILLPSILLPLLVLAAPCQAQSVANKSVADSDSAYLQERAKSLNGRIDSAVKKHKVSKKKAEKLHLSVRQVQTLAGKLQARDGKISRTDADRMNQQLTDVERTFTNQR